MTLRITSAASLAVIVLASALPARAECIVTRFAYDVARGWERNNCWPRPFSQPDRQAARTPFVIMVRNGWRRENLLSQHHFETDTGTLNPAGQEKLRWILLQAPQQHRTIYVSRATRPDETANRVTSVHEIAGQILPSGVVPTVIETDIVADGWPAERIDLIGRKFRDSAPEPRLPEASSSGESQ